jgi:hypothetical protein
MQQIRIASPCSADWNRMAGDDRVRYCPQCKLNVYNFSKLSTAEIGLIVAAREGRLCARFYQRSDGTMLTQNCPVGIRGALLRSWRVASATLTAILTLTPALVASAETSERLQLTQIQAAEPVLEVVDPAGSAISNAVITLVNEKTGNRIEARTSENGQLRMSDVTPGLYELTISANGFAPFKQAHISLPVRETARFQLALGALMGEVVMIQHPNALHRFASRIRRAF